MGKKVLIILVSLLISLFPFLTFNDTVIADTVQKNEWCWCPKYIANTFYLTSYTNAKDMGKILEENGFKKRKTGSTPKPWDVVIMMPGVFKNSSDSAAKKYGHIAIVYSVATDKNDKTKWKMTTEQAGNSVPGYKTITKNKCTNVQVGVSWAAFSKTDKNYVFYTGKIKSAFISPITFIGI